VIVGRAQLHLGLALWLLMIPVSATTRFSRKTTIELLKYCHFLEGAEGHKMKLWFIRDIDLREIDFVVIKNNKPLFAVECKTGEGHL
jgi:hypothetical protein